MNEEITPETVERVQVFRKLLKKMCLSPNQVPVIMTRKKNLLLIGGMGDDANVILFPLIKGEMKLISADSLIAGKRDNPKHIKPS